MVLAELVVPFSNSKISNHSILQILGKVVTSNTWPLCAAAFSEQYCVCRRVTRVQPGHGSVHSAASHCAVPGGVAVWTAALGARPVTCVRPSWILRGAGLLEGSAQLSRGLFQDRALETTAFC